MKTGTIYKITNTKNATIYVGKTVQTIKARWGSHCVAAKRGEGNALGRAIRKYGKDSFIIEPLVENVPEYFLNPFEKYWIHFYNSFKGHGYNCTAGGDGTSGRIPWNKGIPQTEETKRKLSVANKGKIPTNLEALRKFSAGRVGELNPNFKAANIYNYETNALIAENISISQWCRENGYSQGTMSNTARGLRKQYKGLYAKYIKKDPLE